MKKRLKIKLIATLTICCFFTAAAGQGIEFMYNLDSALNKAKQENKLIFIDFYTSWCLPCKVMSKEVFPTEQAGNFYNANFINLKIQCDDEGPGVKIGEKFQVIAYPTLMYIDKDENIVHSTAGSSSVEGFIELGRLALNPDKNLSSITKIWDQGKRDPAFVKEYFNALNAAFLKLKAKDDFEEYFKNLKPSEKANSNTFSLFKIVGPQKNSDVFRYVENNKEEYYKTIGKKTVDRFIRDVYFGHMSSFQYGDPSKDFKVEMEKFKHKNYPFYDELYMLMWVYAKDSLGKPDVKEYIKRGTEFLNKYGEKEDAYTLQLTSLLGNFTGRANAGAEGIVWMENLLARNRNPNYLSVYCYILWRNHQYDKALEVAQEMRNNALKNNRPTSGIDKQIDMIKGLILNNTEKKS